MKIKGFQKLTLLDYPEKMACLLFTGGCNFRCPFCHNASLVTHIESDDINEEEIFNYLEKRKGLLEAVVISGGEPCIQKDLISFIQKIKEKGFLVKLDTNGSFPEILKELLNFHLVDYVAMDVKNIERKYPLTVGLQPDYAKIKESIDLLKASPIDHEFRTTVVKEYHTKEDINQISNLVYPSKLYLQQFKDSGDLIGSNLHAYTNKEMHEIKDFCQLENVMLRGID